MAIESFKISQFSGGCIPHDPHSGLPLGPLQDLSMINKYPDFKYSKGWEKEQLQTVAKKAKEIPKCSKIATLQMTARIF